MRAAWVVVVLGLVAGCEPRTPAEQKTWDDQRAIDNRDGTDIDAILMAEKAVKACLKFPHDASFSWGPNARKIPPATGAGPCRWIVSGTVTAKNGLGLSLTHEYTAQVYLSGNTWSAYSVSLDGEEIASSREGFDARAAAEVKENADKQVTERKAEIAAQKEVLKVEQEPLRWRTWQGVDGEAKFLRSGAGKATLENRDGSKVDVPLDSLSDDDRDWIKDWAKKKALGK